MELIKKYYTTAFYLLGGLLSLLIVINIGKMTAAQDPAVEAAISDNTAGMGVSFVMPLIWIAAILTIGFSIYKIVQNKTMLIRFGIGIVLLGVCFLISYASSSDDVTTISASIPFTGGELKFVGAMVKTLYALLFLSIGALIVGEVKKILN